MKFFLIFPLFTLTLWGQSVAPLKVTHEEFVSSPALSIKAADTILAENLVNIIKLVEKGYINKELLKKVSKNANSSKHFKLFSPWLESILSISNTSKSSELINLCSKYATRTASIPLEKTLERIAGNYCRERTLEAISHDIDENKSIADEAVQFIQENLTFYLTKKNKKNFAFFIRSQSDKPEILKKISTEVTTYSVSNSIIPSQEILKDMLINESITQLIQEKGFNSVQHQNVFYAEYGKLIETSYKVLKDDTQKEKAKEQFNSLKNFLELNIDHLPVGLCLTRLNDFAKAVFRAELSDLSREIFKYIIKKNNKEVQEDALFFYLWTYLYHNDFKSALTLAKEHGLLKKADEILDPRLKFWIAFSHETTGNTKLAVEQFENIVFNHPLSYYAIMSVKKIQSLKPDSAAVSFYSTSIKDLPSISFDVKTLDEDYQSSLIRLKAWSKIDATKLIKLELKRIRQHHMVNFVDDLSSSKQDAARSDLHLINARIIHSSQNYLPAFRYLYEVLDTKEVLFNRALLEILYPQPYMDQLSKVLKKQELDPIVILSLIRQESVFNPMARSPVGARGLMQLMPTTARRMRRSIRDRHLVNPQINLELGTKYFQNLFKRYDGNLVYVLSAYNAGESRVEKWKGNLFDSDATILKNIEAIPFLETRNYVKLIFRNIFFYKLLLDKNQLIDPIEPNQIFDVKLGFKH